jgi:hypothetical protein
MKLNPILISAMSAIVLGSIQHSFGAANFDDLELKAIFRIIERNYAPLELKEKTIGLNWEEKKIEFLNELSTVETNIEYYDLVSRVFGSLQDQHVNFSAKLGQKAALPIEFAYVENKNILSYFTKDAFYNSCPKMKVGDELVSIDGLTDENLYSLLAPYYEKGRDKLNRINIAGYFTWRNSASGLPKELMPEENQAVVVMKNKLEEYSCQFNWKFDSVNPPVLNENFYIDLGLLEQLQVAKVEENEIQKLKNIMNLENRINKLVNTKVESKNRVNNGLPYSLGEKQTFFILPKDFKEIKAPLIFRKKQKKENKLFAGTFKNSKGETIGYLRIPTYDADTGPLSYFATKYFIEQLQKKTSALIVDQFNNPGGYITFADFFIDLLSPNGADNSKRVKFEMTLNESNVNDYLSLLEEILYLIKGTQNAKDKKYLQSLASEVEATLIEVQTAYENTDRISKKVSLSLLSEYIQYTYNGMLNSLIGKIATLPLAFKNVDLKREQGYTKPIYFLINEYDVSCADYVPANLQDFTNIKLVGTTTSGGGGTVEEFSLRMDHELTFSLTTSLMKREKEGIQYIENYGVEPHIPFEIKIADYRSGFTGTFNRLLKTIGLE